MKNILLGAALIANSSLALATEFGSGHLELNTENNTHINALMLNATADINITAMTAQVILKQTFQNTTQEWAHGRYVFPLPENAAVSAFNFQIDERVIKGKIEEKQQAKKQFKQAKREGKHAALVESQRPNLFTLSLANIPPGKQITAKLIYLQPTEYKNGVFSLRLPTTLTPRYIPGKPIFAENNLEGALKINQNQQGWAYNTAQVPDARQITPFQTRDALTQNKIQIRARINTGFGLAHITSASHAIEWETQQGETLLKLSNKTVPMNRDFELSWSPKAGAEPAAAVFVEDHPEARFINLMLMPPQPSADSGQALLRDIVFVVDSSGSMAGNSMRQAKRSLITALNRLSTNDRFEIIDFDNVARPLFGQTMHVNNQTLANAAHFVRNLNADGGTEISTALRAAFAGKTDEQRLKQIVFITDGSVGNEAELLAMINRDLGTARLFTVGIGSAPNSYFMRKAAEVGKGTYTYVDNINEVEHEMSTLFTQLEQPLLRNIKIQWPDGTQAESFPASLSDLYAGEPLIIKAKTNAILGDILISGTLRNQPWQRTLILPKTGAHENIASLWARAKIENLMDGFHAGKTEQQIKPAVLTLALKHQLASKYTSFIAIDSQPTRPKQIKADTHNIANLMPAGNAMTTPWPNTATSAQLSLYLSLPFLFMSFLLWRRQRHTELDTLS